MKSSNAPFNEFGQSMILRDIEDLYIGLNTIGSQLNALSASLAGIFQAFTGLGTMAYQNATAVAITGGTLATLTSLGATAGSLNYALDAVNYVKFPAQGANLGAEVSGGSGSQISIVKLYKTGMALEATGTGSMAMTFTSPSMTFTYGSALLRTIVFDDVLGAQFNAAEPVWANGGYRVASASGVWNSTSLIVGGITLTGGTSRLTGAQLSINGGNDGIGASQVTIAGNKVVGARGSAVTAPSGGATIDTQARTAISDLISRMQAHGLIS